MADFNLIQVQITEEHAQKEKTYWNLFRNWPNLCRTILVMIQASCQMTSFSAIQYFSPQIFAQISTATSLRLLFQAVNAIITFLSTTVCILIIQSIGRRPLEIYGAIIMSTTYIANAALIKVFPTTSTNRTAHWVFIVTTGPLSWAIPAELFGTTLRTKHVAWGAMTSFAFNTIVGQITPIAITAISWRFHIIFIVCNLASALFSCVFLPEAKGLNLDELFYESPTFIPGSHWKPTSQLDDAARKIAKQEREIVILKDRNDSEGKSPANGHFNNVR